MKSIIVSLAVLLLHLNLIGASSDSDEVSQFIPEVPQIKLVREFKIIDKQLANELPKGASDDELIQKIAIYRGDANKTFGKWVRKFALITLSQLAELSEGYCPGNMRVLHEAEYGLGDSERNSWVHLDGFVERVANQIAASCPSKEDVFRGLNRFFFRPEYDQMDRYLNKMHPNGESSIELLMASISKQYEPLDEDKRFKEALKQLEALKGFDDEQQVQCIEQEYDLLLRNEIAVRSKDNSYSNRLINKLVGHYSTKHASICRGRNMERFQLAMQSLGPKELDYLSIVPNGFLSLENQKLRVKRPIANYENFKSQLSKAKNLAVIRDSKFNGDSRFPHYRFPVETFKSQLTTLLAESDQPAKMLKLVNGNFDGSNEMANDFVRLVKEVMHEPCISIRSKLSPSVKSLEKDNMALDGQMHFTNELNEDQLSFNLVRLTLAWCWRAPSSFDISQYLSQHNYSSDSESED